MNPLQMLVTMASISLGSSTGSFVPLFERYDPAPTQASIEESLRKAQEKRDRKNAKRRMT